MQKDSAVAPTKIATMPNRLVVRAAVDRNLWPMPPVTTSFNGARNIIIPTINGAIGA
ncbi:MAG: hypothetical protein ACYSWQ_19785 [Planctomycetota bacterium]